MDFPEKLFSDGRSTLESSPKFRLVRLVGGEDNELVQQFVAMMAKMYEFHATLHPDWEPKTGWQNGSANWLKKGAGGKDWFFAMAYSRIAKENLAPLGYIIASFHYEAPLFIINRFGYIADLWVEPPQRGSGVAGFLLEAATGFFKSQGVARVQLEVMSNNAGGRRFWEKAGFEVFEIIMRKNI